MSFIPAFKIGLWNAWIFMVFLMATSYLPSLIDKEKMGKRMEEEPAWSEQSKTTKIVFVITHIMIMPFTFVYSIFLPLRTNKPGYLLHLKTSRVF
jgi:membrane protein insertase Oxa1/YidC/SpoIIIJ